MLSDKIKLLINNLITIEKKYQENKILFIDMQENIKTIEEIFVSKTEIQDFWGIK